MKNTVKNIESQLTLFKYLALGFFVSGILVPIVWLCFKDVNFGNLQIMQNWGLFGDFFGGTTGTLWAAAGACVVYMAFLGQMLDIKKNDNLNEIENLDKIFREIEEDSKTIQQTINVFAPYSGVINHVRLSQLLVQEFHTTKINRTDLTEEFVSIQFKNFISSHAILGSFLMKTKKFLQKISYSNLDTGEKEDIMENLVSKYGPSFKLLLFYFILQDNDVAFKNLIKRNNFISSGDIPHNFDNSFFKPSV